MPEHPSLFQCPDCKAQQPETGRCGRCPGVVQAVRWDAGPCYICGQHVAPADSWHREDYDGVSRHWCPAHQPVWSRPPGMTDLMVTPESIDAYLTENPPPKDEVATMTEGRTNTTPSHWCGVAWEAHVKEGDRHSCVLVPGHSGEHLCGCGASFIEAVADRIIAEYGETLRRLANDD